MNRRKYKKRYKAAVDYISHKISLAFANEAERVASVSEITNLRMQDIEQKKKHGES